MAIGQFVGIFRRHGKDGEVRLGWGHGVDPPPAQGSGNGYFLCTSKGWKGECEWGIGEGIVVSDSRAESGEGRGVGR